jgi:hypothetical protein
LSHLEITPAPSDDEAAAIAIALREFEEPPATPVAQSQWKMSGRQYDEDNEAISR